MVLSPAEDTAFAVGLTNTDRTGFHSTPFAKRLGDNGSIEVSPRTETRAAALARLPQGAEDTCHLRNIGTTFSMSKFAHQRDAPLVVGCVSDPATFSKPCVGAMDLLIRPAGTAVASLPTELAQFEQPVCLALETFDALSPNASSYYVYVQVFSGDVPPGKTQRPRSIHADGFQGKRQLNENGEHHLAVGYNFLVVDAQPTEFFPYPVDVSDLDLERHDFCKCFNTRLASSKPVVGRPFELVMFDGYSLHRSPANASHVTLPRTLLNVSFSQQLFDSAANTLNAAFEAIYPPVMHHKPCIFLSFKGGPSQSPKTAAEETMLRDFEGLPLHLACTSRAHPSPSISDVLMLISKNPEAVRTKSPKGELPIHVNLQRKFMSVKEAESTAQLQRNFGAKESVAYLADAIIEKERKLYADITKALLDKYPEGARERGLRGLLPLHLAYMNDAPADAITALLAAYPAAVECIIAIKGVYFDFETCEEFSLPENVNPRDDDIQSLCANLGRFKRLKKIVLSCSYLTDAGGGRAIVHGLKGSNSVTEVRLSDHEKNFSKAVQQEISALVKRNKDEPEQRLAEVAAIANKYDVLKCSAPAVDFDCSGLYDPRHLLHVVHAAAQHSAAASVTSINMSHSCLTQDVSVKLLQLLQRFAALQHVNISGNPGLKLLPVAFITAAARYKSFNCAGCSLVLPPQRIFMSPEDGPRAISEFFQSTSLDISNSQLSFQSSAAVASVLQSLPSLQHVVMHSNPGLGTAGVTSIVLSLAGDIKSIDVRSCGLDSWFLPVPIIANLPRLKVLQCISESEVKGSKLCLPPAQVCSVGIESIKKFFFQPEQKDLEGAAVSTTLLLSSGATVPREIIDIIMALWHDGSQGLEDAPPMAQQLWVSLVSHQNSDRFAPLVEKFLDKYLDRVSDVMKWKDHSGRTAAATALSSCKRAMLSRSLVMGLYDIPDGLQHEYKSATCTVYLAHRVEGEKRTMVALKFMKNADEFEREKSSRKMLLAPCSGQEQAPQDYIMESTDSYHHENAVFHSSVQKRKWLVDYPNPCLLVMPAADRNLRIIMDNERITNHEAIKSMFHRILRCAKYMHDRGFIHGDLKPRNVMRILHRLVLIDFDASARIGKQYSWSKHSSAYMPPEAIRLQLSLRSVDFAIVDSSDPTRCTVSFTFSLPVAIPIGTTFNVSISPAKVTAVHSFILNGATELHGCINIHDRGITVTSNATLVAAKHSFTLVALFHGQLPAADCMSARLDHFLNTMLPNDGISKDILAECITIIRNPNIDAKLAAAECICSCSIMLRELEHIPDECTGLCGLAHTGHDIWALGVILFRFSARESLFSEDDEDNIKDGSGRLKLALWTDAFKQQRLQKIDDTATRVLVSKLLEKEPWKRPRCISDVLAMPFNEMDVIKLKLQQTVPSDASQSSNLVGSVKDLRTGKFSDAAYGLRPYLKVADDWSEDAACTLQGMQDEVDLLKDCPDCAQVQADVLQQLGRSEAAATQKLASALAELKEQRKKGAKLAAADVVKALRSDISALEGWHYGLPNSISWPTDKLKSGYRTYCQPMCKGCQDYCLDHSSIFADLHYIMHEPAVEKKEWNGIRDHGRAGRRLKDFMTLPQATEALLTEAELAALRFYTSHSFNALNIAMRDSGRQGPHPLPGIMMNMQRGLKKLRALGSNDASSKQTVVLWRGMSYMHLTQQFNAEGGTELAPMSTTTDVSVAISYAVKKDTRSALLFRFVTRNNLERGADVQWLSMFPGESETLFPPLTFLQRTRTEPQQVEHNGVTVTIVELSTTLA